MKKLILLAMLSTASAQQYDTIYAPVVYPDWYIQAEQLATQRRIANEIEYDNWRRRIREITEPSHESPTINIHINTQE